MFALQLGLRGVVHGPGNIQGVLFLERPDRRGEVIGFRCIDIARKAAEVPQPCLLAFDRIDGIEVAEVQDKDLLGLSFRTQPQGSFPGVRRDRLLHPSVPICLPITRRTVDDEEIRNVGAGFSVEHQLDVQLGRNPLPAEPVLLVRSAALLLEAYLRDEDLVSREKDVRILAQVLQRPIACVVPERVGEVPFCEGNAGDAITCLNHMNGAFAAHGDTVPIRKPTRLENACRLCPPMRQSQGPHPWDLATGNSHLQAACPHAGNHGPRRVRAPGLQPKNSRMQAACPHAAAPGNTNIPG